MCIIDILSPVVSKVLNIVYSLLLCSTKFIVIYNFKTVML